MLLALHFEHKEASQARNNVTEEFRRGREAGGIELASGYFREKPAQENCAATILAEIAVGEPLNNTIEIVGPELPGSPVSDRAGGQNPHGAAIR